MKTKKLYLSILSNLDFFIAGIALTSLIILTFLGVIWRYFLNEPFTWLEEIQTACMVWIVFAGSGAAFRTGNHVAIEMIIDILPQKLQKIAEICITIIVFIVIGYLFYQSIGFIELFIKSGRSTNMLKIPYFIIYGISIISYIDVIISYIFSIVTGVKSEAKEAAQGE